MPKNLKESSGKDKGASSHAATGGIGQKEDTSDKLFELQEILQQRERDLEIEASMERVRSRSLAMQSSEELNDVLSVLYQQFDLLGIHPLTVWLTLWTPEENTFTYRSTGISGKRIQGQQVVDIEGMDIWKALYVKWKSGTSEDVEVLFYAKKDLKQLFSLLAETFEDMPAEERLTAAHFPEGGYSVQGHCKFGYIGYTHTADPTQEEKDILSRFAKEFGRVYQRFLDIEKAEAMAREALIEVALERVRSCIMAMESPKDLKQVAAEVRRQIVLLGQVDLEVSVVHLYEKDSPYFHSVAAIPMPNGEINCMESFFPVDATVETIQMMENYWAGKQEYTIKLTRQKAREWQQILLKNNPDLGVRREEIISNLPLPDQPEYWNFSDFSGGSFLIVTHALPTPEALDLLRRSSKIFDLAYRRYLDLVKAEAQAREAEIEAALEKVRNSSLSMHQSNQMQQVSNSVYEQLNQLGLEMDAVGMSGVIEAEKSYEVWVGGSDFYEPLHIPYTDSTKVQRDYNKAIAERPELFTRTYSGKTKKEYVDFLMSENQFPKDLRNKMLKSKAFSTSIAFAKNSGIQIARYTAESYSEKENQILKRFCKVFEQAYIRFLDLQKAETQAREAQIEAALERVRSRSMAMHKSEELKGVIRVIFDQLALLDISAEHAGIVVDYEPKKDFHFWVADNQDIPARITVPYLGLVWDRQFTEAKKKGEDFFTTQLDFEEKNSFYKKLLPHIEGLTKQAADFYFSCPGLAASTIIQKDIGLYIENFSGIPFSNEENTILMRFGNVFQQAYTRFLDLQTAEEQAREAQIEAALERVRGRSMAMHHSSELGDVAAVLFDQLNELVGELWTCGFVLCEKDRKEDEWWLSMDGGFTRGFFLPNVGDYTHATLYEGWVKGEDFRTVQLEGDSLQEHYNWLMDIPTARKIFEDMEASGIKRPEWQKLHAAYFSKGYLCIITQIPCQEEEVFKRFAQAFDLTYTRFLDLKKAEAQARESEIEAALERVRSKTMAMHNSQDVSNTVITLFQELIKLGLDESIRCGIGILEGNEGMETWSANADQKGAVNLKMGMLNMTIHPMLKGLKKAWKKGEEGYSYHFEGADVTSYYTALNKEPEYPFDVDLSTLPDNQFAKTFFFREGILFAFTKTPLSEEAIRVLGRFADVFGQTYRRYLDLLKAEAQAREAQIEAALEKIRTRTMAMQKGEELKDVVFLLYKELIALGVTNFVTCGYVEINEEIKRQITWVTSRGGDTLGLFYLPLTGDATFDERYAAWKRKQSIFHQTVAGETRTDHLEYAITTFNSKEAEEMVRSQFPDPTVFYCFNFSHGYLHLVTGSKLEEGEEILLVRFTKVFEQTYARFLDLQLAEAQALEARIENALEKVRSRTMAMQHSDELPEAANVLFLEVQALGMPAWSCGYNILAEDMKSATCWMSSEGTLQKPFNLRLWGEASFEEMGAFIRSDETFLVQELGGQAIEAHYDHMISFPDLVPIFEALKAEGLSLPAYQINHLCKFSYGFLLFITYEKVPEAHEIFKRFTTVFEQTYTRFLDLKKAEAQARKAQIETALERVRSRTMAMQHSDELAEASHLLDKEVRGLGIKTWGCAFNIYRENDSIEWFGNEKGLLPTYTVPREGIFKEYYDRGQKGESLFIKEIAGEECLAHYEFMSTLPVVGDVLKQLKETNGSFPSYQIDHVVYFKYGYLLFITREQVPEAHDIFKQFARVFEQTYTRFLDLQLKEKQAFELAEEKKRLEQTLEDLKSTQTQLVHSEKMASLGELTAGIAHEIKNPLNFVNNFSEVSSEMIDEMFEELDKRDLEEVKAIGKDLKQNLEKIAHHGNRADSIVRGMLQHSRSGDGKKEPTDINALADEYLRLAYHGLRAKDKAFNAAMDTDFDDSLGKVDVIPQDMGRVLLNLITNAFHAVSERRGKETKGYEPTLWVKTRKSENGIEITVRDNGGGIPDEIRDKIFQPFFTTKPTGEGTGLGLSMSYDIITKGHGGSLKMETTPGEGTTFFINLKISD